MPVRYAIYFAPAEASALWQAGCRWLGRDPLTGAQLPRPEVGGWSADRIAKITASPRMYGLHATLKPPFRLAEGRTVAQLALAIQELATRLQPFTVPQLSVKSLDGFLALQPAGADAKLSALADACVTGLDDFRRPPSAQELAQRRAARLSARQDELLAQFGYPYVLDQYRFHMTLTERLPSAEAHLLEPWLRDYLADALAVPLRCDDVCLFVQNAPREAFLLQQRFPLDIR
jgi:putative phosphonate metabolism protein